MKQKTAIQWLYDELKKEGIGIVYSYEYLFKEAKELEKSQIVTAYTVANTEDTVGVSIKRAYDFYNDKFFEDAE